MADTLYPDAHYSEAHETVFEGDSDDSASGSSTPQSISGSNIDSGKLITLLRTKFGAGAYNLRVSTEMRRAGEAIADEL